jgi:hypothetical protein
MKSITQTYEADDGCASRSRRRAGGSQQQYLAALAAFKGYVSDANHDGREAHRQRAIREKGYRQQFSRDEVRRFL